MISSKPDVMPQNSSDSYTSRKTYDRVHVLIVEDDRIMRMMMEEQVEDLGYMTSLAVNGRDAYEQLIKENSSVDIVLLDREMPEMNGMELIKRMKLDQNLRHVPIVMATASDKSEQVKEGIDAGVFYYLTKPFDRGVLKSVLRSAVRELRKQNILNEELRKHKATFELIDTAIFNVTTLDEAENLAAFLANCYPDPERVILGLAELIINGIEHGNLKITYDEKTDLIERSMWQHEVDYRCNLPENQGKKVQVTFRRNDDGLYVRIEDEGDGFDWKHCLKIDPEHVQDNHGRGIGIARTNAISFDRLEYNTAGNVVTAIIYDQNEADW